MKLLVAVLTLTLTGCGAAQHSACNYDRLAEIEASYVEEVVAACFDQSYADCPARPAIDAKYDAIREQWVVCE